ncbi:MAG: SDR family oxidoreductase [Deltaproteobacteria bacterium]|nr:SDR family oxidoreductase [Deltaproteobacteria bacterium]
MNNSREESAFKGGLDSYDIVIIGASGGIGQSLIKSLSGTNRIIGTYCHCAATDLVKGPSYYKVDLLESKSVSNFCSTIAADLRRPVLIYTPGISPNCLAHKISDDEWEQILTINLTGAMRVTRGLLPKMVEVGFGRIIYVSSILSRKAVPGTAAYSAAKAGICAFSRVVALENAKKGITSNALALGYFNVGIINAVPDDYLHNTVIPGIPVGHLGDPSNILEAVKFLVNADFITGATIDINGGIISG